ncbi:MAG: DUF4153 domain-containing protein [Bacteroidota bacterium]|nr:DUF4153 domain-containing protein [Bacteroidota bacterium]
MKTDFWDSIFDSIKRSLVRFPLTIVSALVGSCLYFYLIEEKPFEGALAKLVLTTHLGIALFTAIQLFWESRTFQEIVRWVFYAIGILILTAFYLSIEDVNFEITAHQFVLSLICCHLLVSFASFTKTHSNESFWIFNQECFFQFCIGLLYSAVLIAGLEGAVAAIRALFEFEWYRDIYFDIPIAILGIFNTIFWTSRIPIKFNEQTIDFARPKFVLNLTKFILIPISLLYFAILYAYGLKIIVQWNLPQGWVSSLCIGFSLVGMLTYLLNFILPNYDSGKHIHFYKKYFFYLIIPILVLMLVAIERRISDYGITEERYYILSMAILLSAISLYYIISRKDDLRIIPISLFIVCLIAAYGPLSAWNTSIRSQVARFKAPLERVQLQGDQDLRSVLDSLTYDEKVNMSSILRYLNERRALDQLIAYFPKEATRYFETGRDNYMIVDTMVRILDAELDRRYQYFNVTLNGDFSQATKIHEYDELSYYSFYDTNSERVDISLKEHRFLEFKDGSKIDLVKILQEKHPEAFLRQENFNYLLEFPVELNSGKALIKIKHVGIDKQNQDFKINNIEFILLKQHKVD